MDELVASLNDAFRSCESCEAALATVAARYDAAAEHGIVGSSLALDLAMENLSQAHERFINTMTVALDVDAGDRTATEPALVRQVGADMSEEHSTAAPEETAERNTVVPEETAEQNTAEPEETVEYKIIMDELIEDLNVAIENFNGTFTTAEAEYNAANHLWMMSPDLTFDLAIEKLNQAREHYEEVANNARHFFDTIIREMVIIAAPEETSHTTEHNTAASEETVEGNMATP